MAARSKGTGGAGCCCGGCWSPPSDGRSASTADIIAVQQACCRCIPKYLCATLSASEGYDDSNTLLERFCGSELDGDNPYPGGAVQFIGTLYRDGDPVNIRVRLVVHYDVCFIEWDIPELGDSGSREINHNQSAGSYDCELGMKTEACVNFGGTWELSDRTLTLAPPEMLDIQSNIDCAGCRCMCKCLCMSIFSEAVDGLTTVVASNEVVCSAIETTEQFNCDSSLTEDTRQAVWESNGWVVSLGGKSDSPPSIKTISVGTQTALGCNLQDTFRFADGFEHVIEAASGSVVVTYEWNIGTETPLSFRWIGRSYEEDSVALFEFYNWTSSQWEEVGQAGGRPITTDVNRLVKSRLGAEHTGAGGDLGRVILRITLFYGTELTTDLLRLTYTECCELALSPPAGIAPTAPIPPLRLTPPSTCPTVFHAWQFTDTNGVNWTVSIDCAWCGGKCGTVFTGCCSRPIARTLFAEVSIDCPTCTDPFVVALIDVGGGTWSGQGVHCGQPFDVTFACSGTGWVISCLGAGACSFSGSATSTDCDPFNVEFSGQFGGGLGCCGPSGPPVTTTNINIVVFE